MSVYIIINFFMKKKKIPDVREDFFKLHGNFVQV